MTGSEPPAAAACHDSDLAGSAGPGSLAGPGPGRASSELLFLPARQRASVLLAS